MGVTMAIASKALVYSSDRRRTMTVGDGAAIASTADKQTYLIVYTATALYYI